MVTRCRNGKDDGTLSGLSGAGEPLDEPVSVQARHHQVEQNHGAIDGLQTIQCLDAVACFGADQAEPLQSCPQHGADRFIVIDDQDVNPSEPHLPRVQLCTERSRADFLRCESIPVSGEGLPAGTGHDAAIGAP